MPDTSDVRGLATYQQFWTAAAKYLRWAGHDAKQQVHAAQQRLQNGSRPSVPEDMQLKGFTPLQNTAHSMQTPEQVS
jgi:hypothetical protein